MNANLTNADILIRDIYQDDTGKLYPTLITVDFDDANPFTNEMRERIEASNPGIKLTLVERVVWLESGEGLFVSEYVTLYEWQLTRR